MEYGGDTTEPKSVLSIVVQKQVCHSPLRAANVAMFRGASKLREDSVVLGAAGSDGECVTLGGEELGECVELLSFSDVVSASCGVLDALVLDGAVFLHLGQGEPGLFGNGGETDEEGTGGLGEESLLRFVGGEVSIEPRLAQVLDYVGDKVALVCINVGEVTQNATEGGELHAEFGVGDGALLCQQRLEALEANDDLIVGRMIQEREVKRRNAEI